MLFFVFELIDVRIVIILINNYKTNSHKNYESFKSMSNSEAPFLDDMNAFKIESMKKGL